MWIAVLSIFLCREDTVISELFINEQIRDKEVRVIGEDGEQLGIMSSREALQMAEDAGVLIWLKLHRQQNRRYVSW